MYNRLQVFNKLASSLTRTNKRGFAGIDLKRKPTRRDLDHYEVIVVGGNLGGIFSRHFD